MTQKKRKKRHIVHVDFDDATHARLQEIAAAKRWTLTTTVKVAVEVLIKATDAPKDPIRT